jgi:hypothetical protein
VASFKIRIDGATATAREFQNLSLRVPDRLRDTLEKGASRLRDAAQAEAIGKGDVYAGRGDHGDPARKPGDLARKISVYRYPTRFDVVEHSRTRTRLYPGGYAYPRRLEYGGGGARAFMRPAAEKMAPVITVMVDEMLDRLFLEEGF